MNEYLQQLFIDDQWKTINTTDKSIFEILDSQFITNVKVENGITYYSIIDNNGSVIQFRIIKK